MNNQQFFDITIAHLRLQKVPAVVTRKRADGTDNVACVYRGTTDGSGWTPETPADKTLMCAVGKHLPDALIAQHMYINTESFGSLIDEDDAPDAQVREVVNTIFAGVDHELIVHMQGVHDHAGAKSEVRDDREYVRFEGPAFEDKLREAARMYKLDYRRVA